jgi:hypothetical protein
MVHAQARGKVTVAPQAANTGHTQKTGGALAQAVTHVPRSPWGSETSFNAENTFSEQIFDILDLLCERFYCDGQRRI